MSTNTAAGAGHGPTPVASESSSATRITTGRAILLECKIHRLPARLLVAELLFEVPLDYAKPDDQKINLFARAAFSYEKPITDDLHDLYDPADSADCFNDMSRKELQERFTKPWLIYCEGGPGMGNREPNEYAFLHQMLGRGYQMLFVDYRGTGLSTPITHDTTKHIETPEARADYLSYFRADNIVRDLEAVRKCLILNPGRTLNHTKWSIMGQSFGGFVILTYLSFYSEGLREAFMTGGMAPINVAPDVVYRATYNKAIERNAAYFRKYPEDILALCKISGFLNAQAEPGQVKMPGGGVLTMHRVMTFGLMFGVHGGLDMTHSLILRMVSNIENLGVLTRATLTAIEQFFPLDVAPMYALVHEAIYCYTRGVASNWAALRVGREFPLFEWVDHEHMPLIDPNRVTKEFCFSGEMILPFMYDTYPELMEWKREAQLLAERTDWPDLYDEAQLAKNNVPVYAVTYIDDLFVDYKLAKQAAAKVRRVHMFETNSLYHNASRARTDEVMMHLLRLRDDTID